MSSAIALLAADRAGTTAVEYALIAALIALGGLVGFDALHTAVSTMYGMISNGVANSSDF